MVDGRFFTANGRANFIAVHPALPESAADCGSGQLTLNTGRLRDQWHTMTRTGRVPRLMRHRDFFSVSLSPADALSQGLAESDLVQVHNGSWLVTALVLIDDALPPGQVFSPIHWSNQYSGNACINQLDTAGCRPGFRSTPVEICPGFPVAASPSTAGVAC